MIVCVFLLLTGGCRPEQGARGQAIVTERQACFLKDYMHLTEEVFPLTIEMDIPVKGSGAVMDSITAFLNETLYQFFDDSQECHLSFEDVFSKDTKQLAAHYREAYAPFFRSDGMDMHEFSSDCLEVYLAAQTDTYVTYGIHSIFYGEGLEIATEWVTFFKSDGHRLAEVISASDLLSFYENHPEYRNEDIWEAILDQNQDEVRMLTILDGSVGLLEDSVAHQFVFAPGIFEDVYYPLTAIAPFLSKEARQLTAL